MEPGDVLTRTVPSSLLSHPLRYTRARRAAAWDRVSASPACCNRTPSHRCQNVAAHRGFDHCSTDVSRFTPFAAAELHFEIHTYRSSKEGDSDTNQDSPMIVR